MSAHKLPDKTVERLSIYRRILISYQSSGNQYIFSHELASLIHITPVQVRRDLMLIGHSGTLRRGYEIRELINILARILDSERGIRVAVVGVGKLGSAIINYFTGKRAKLSMVAAFDVAPEKINRLYAGVYCYPTERLKEVIKSEDIDIAILTVPPGVVAATVEELVMAGVRGILNYTSTPVNVPSHIYLQEYDMLTSLEKVAYFVKKNISR